jgi:hypothetical protein
MVWAVEIVDRTPDEYLSSITDEAIRAHMLRLDSVISDAMPGRCRRLWEGIFWGGTEQSIIGYGDLVQPRPRGKTVEWFLVGLARQKKHFSLYVNAVVDGVYLGQHDADRLGNVKVGAASITFTRVDGVDLGALRELLGRADELTPPDRRES